MKQVVVLLLLGGCTVPWAQGPEMSASNCNASCEAHYERCPQIFAQFPERGAVECPAEHQKCLTACSSRHPVRSASAPASMPASPPIALPPPGAASAIPPGIAPEPQRANPPMSSKEAKLRELKHLYQEGLVTDEVYRDLQKTILSEP